MAKKPKSTGTGRFTICYGAVVKADHQVYLVIKQGPSGSYFVHCPLCGLKAFFNGPFWWEAGMPLDEIRRRCHYTQIIAATPPFPARDPASGPAQAGTPRGRTVQPSPTPNRRA